MSTLFWLLVIPGAIITYLTLGFFIVLLICIVAFGEYWKEEFKNDLVIPMILCWPLTLVIVLIIAPIAIMRMIIEKITEEN